MLIIAQINGEYLLDYNFLVKNYDYIFNFR